MEQASLLSGAVWLSLPQTTRQKLATLFNLTKTGGVYVVNGANGPEVQSDGYTYKDLSVITMERMQGLLGSDSANFYDLFRAVVANVDDLLLPPNEGVQFYDDSPAQLAAAIEEAGLVVGNSTEVIVIAEEEPKKKGGRKSKAK